MINSACGIHSISDLFFCVGQDRLSEKRILSTPKDGLVSGTAGNFFVASY